MNAFKPSGLTVSFTATPTAPTPVFAETVGLNNKSSYRIVNAGNATVFIGYGSSSNDATNKATLSTGIPVFAGSIEVFTFDGDYYFTGVTQSGSSTVFITPGEGI